MRSNSRGFGPWLTACACALAIFATACPEDPGSSFQWSVTPDRRQVVQGTPAVFQIKVDSKQNINSTVKLSATGVPNGTTAVFSNPNLGSTGRTSSLTFETSDVVIGTYTVTVRAEEVGYTTYTADRLLIVTGESSEADFSLEVNPGEYSFPSFETAHTFTFYVRPLNGFLGTVDIALSGLNENLDLAQDVTPASLEFTNSGGAGGTFILGAVQTSDMPAYVDVTVTATSGSLVHTGMTRIFFVTP
jgi:hypothetical protein